MILLDEKRVLKYLSAVKEMSFTHKFYDVHVHPYEVVFDKFIYPYGSDKSGVISLSKDGYSIPKTSEMVLDGLMNKVKTADITSLKNITMMRLRYIYGHIGGKVFSDHMELSGINKVLLLPVASSHGEVEEKMIMVRSLYSDNNKFWVAGSVPNTIRNDEICNYVMRMRRDFNIKAIKVHPIITGINLNSEKGKDRLLYILDACGNNYLPFVLHCGDRSDIYEYERGGYALIENIKDIAWGISRSPVVIAHAGLYQCDNIEIQDKVLSVLDNMTSQHDNLYVDISGIGFKSLRKVLTRIDIDRILFGSDALYELQWKKAVTLMYALNDLKMRSEDCYVRISSINPSRIIFKEDSASDSSFKTTDCGIRVNN